MPANGTDPRNGGVEYVYPPSDEPSGYHKIPRKPLIERLKGWQALVSIALALVVVGWGAHHYVSQFATSDDMRRNHSANSSNLASVESRVTRLETDLGWIKAALYQVAKQTGASTVPPPPP